MNMMDQQNRNLTLGKDECSYSKIADIIAKHATGHLLFEDFALVARILKIDAGKITEFQNQIKLDKRKKLDVFIDILAQWHMKEGEKANVEELVNLLKSDFYAIAMELQRAYFPNKNATPNEIAYHSKSSSKIRQPAIISKKMYEDRNSNKRAGPPQESNFRNKDAVSQPLLNTGIRSLSDDVRAVPPEERTGLHGSATKALNNSNNTTSTNHILKKWRNLFCIQHRKRRLAVLILSWIIFILILMINLIIFLKNQSEPVTTTLAPPTLDPITWKPIDRLDYGTPLPEMNIFTGSYDDYKTKMTHLKLPTKINLTIIVSNSTSWRLNDKIMYPAYLSGLSVQGHLPWATILDALEQSYELRSLAIEIYKFTEDDREILLVDDKTIPAYPFKLKKLALRNISNCASFYWSLASSIKINSVNTVSLSEIVIDNDNVESLGRMLRQSENLNHLTISAVANVFKPLSHFVPLENIENLKNLTFELISPTNDQPRYSLFEFPERFPRDCNLERLIGKFGSVNYPDILYCKELKVLNVTVSIAENISLTDISVFVRKLPKLECLIMFLDFEICPENELGGWQILQECLPHFEVRSECIIKKPKSMRVSKYIPIRKFRKDTSCDNNGARKRLDNSSLVNAFQNTTKRTFKSSRL